MVSVLTDINVVYHQGGWKWMNIIMLQDFQQNSINNGIKKDDFYWIVLKMLKAKVIQIYGPSTK